MPLVINTNYLLTADDTIRQDARITALQEQVGTLRGIELNQGNVNGVRATAPGAGTVADFQDRVRVVLHATPAAGKEPVRLWLGTTIAGAVSTSYAIASTFVPGQQHNYLVTGLNYADIVPGTAYYVNIEFTDGTFAYLSVSYTHLRAHETKANLVCRLLLEKKK